MPRPALDEIEISVFGRGSGEAIVVHVGNDQWLLIDSLYDEARRPIALEYLDSLGVSPDVVQAILLTHWHDDHIAGAGDLVSRCRNAVVAIPAALQNDEFLGFIEVADPVGSDEFSSGVKELQIVFATLGARMKSPHWCLAQRRISGGFDAPYEFEALSPSNGEVTRFLQSIKGWLQTQAIGGRLAAPKRNDASVASVVSIGDVLLLFGADLEVSHADSGWQAVFENAWQGRGAASFVKIPHHGSKNAHFGPMWTDMAINQVYAALTPWNKNKGLPTEDDVKRIVSFTKNAFAASRPVSRKALKRMAAVEGTLRDKGIQVRRADDGIGHVRFRLTLGSKESWAVEMSGVGAAPLQHLAA